MSVFLKVQGYFIPHTHNYVQMKKKSKECCMSIFKKHKNSPLCTLKKLNISYMYISDSLISIIFHSFTFKGFLMLQSGSCNIILQQTNINITIFNLKSHTHR